MGFDISETGALIYVQFLFKAVQQILNVPLIFFWVSASYLQCTGTLFLYPQDLSI